MTSHHHSKLDSCDKLKFAEDFKNIYFCLHWVFVAVYGLSLVALLRLLITMSSLVAEDWLQGVQASAVVDGGL